MSQPKKWFLGLIPVAGLLLVAGIARQGSVEADLSARGTADLAAAGLGWAKVTLQGRDAVVTGEAPDPALKSMAVSAADRVLGIRSVSAKITDMPEAKPYTLAAMREGNKVTLTGFAPNAVAKSAIIEAAKKALPGLELVDQLKLARGAPAQHIERTGFGLGELAKLATGTLSLSDSALSLVGRAADLPKFADVRAKLGALPAGTTLAKVEITPPVISPYTFGAEKSAAGVTLTGFVPNEVTRTTVRAFANSMGLPVTDRLQLAAGQPASFLPSVEFGLDQLNRLQTGIMGLSNTALSLSGRAAESAKFSDVRARLASALPKDVTLAKGLAPGDILPPDVKPYPFAAERSATGVTLSGYVPSEVLRTTVLAFANSLGLPVTDRLQIAGGAPATFLPSVEFGMDQLNRLQTGALSITDSALSISGRAGDMAKFDAVKARLASLPRGVSLLKGLGAGDIEAPVIKPYTLDATRGEGQLTLAGYVPDQRTKDDLLGVARRFFQGDQVVDRLVIGLGAPQGYANAVRGGLQDLARLLPGGVFALSDQNASLKGLAHHDVASLEVAKTLRERLPQGYGSLIDVSTAPLPPLIKETPSCQLLFNELLSRARINFDSGSANLSADSIGLLDRLMVGVRRCDTAMIEIAGHTDSDGDAAGNQALSERRAAAVAQYLAKVGIGADRLQPVGYGQTRAVAPNDTPDNKAKNRRIEFTVK